MTGNGSWKIMPFALALAMLAGAATLAEPTSRSAPDVTDSVANAARGAVAIGPGNAIEAMPTVALVSFGGTGAETDDLETVATALEERLAETGEFLVLSRDEFAGILRRRGMRASGACEDERCMLDMGRYLGVQGVLAGELVRDGERHWVLALRQFDVAANAAVFEHHLEVLGSLRDVRGRGCDRMVELLSGKRHPGSNRTIVSGRIVKAWHWIAGSVVVAGGVVAAAILLLDDETEEPAKKAPSDQTVVRW